MIDLVHLISIGAAFGDLFTPTFKIFWFKSWNSTWRKLFDAFSFQEGQSKTGNGFKDKNVWQRRVQGESTRWYQ